EDVVIVRSAKIRDVLRIAAGVQLEQEAVDSAGQAGLLRITRDREIGGYRGPAQVEIVVAIQHTTEEYVIAIAAEEAGIDGSSQIRIDLGDVAIGPQSGVGNRNVPVEGTALTRDIDSAGRIDGDGVGIVIAIIPAKHHALAQFARRVELGEKG